jgi:tetratricopeptide (TPR) repeat protein
MTFQGILHQRIGKRTAIVVVILITFIAFFPILRNGSVFWDDPEYIFHNPLMAASLKVVFTRYYLYNYHPLTILAYTLEHKFFGSKMSGYHLVSLALHIMNCVLVFFFVYYLLNTTKKIRVSAVKFHRSYTQSKMANPGANNSRKNVMVPFVTALLFGIHPMHVESVAWASELKDLLYAFFFLGSLIRYVRYVQLIEHSKRKTWLAGAYILFLFSLFSKGQAVSLPLCFLLTDYFLKRKLRLNIITDKIFFFALSILFGIIAIKAQDKAINHNFQFSIHNYSWGFYGFCLYLFKFILPVNLSGLYPYPLNPDGTIPLIIYFAPVPILLLLFIVYQFFRRNRYVVFGILFFLVNIIFVLKFIPVGDAVIADRYSYMSFIGLSFIVGYGFGEIANYFRLMANSLLILLTVILIPVTIVRTRVWKNSFTFWGDVIKKDGSYWRPYNFIGQEYYNEGDYASAIKYYSEGIKNDKNAPPPIYFARGYAYMEKIHNYDSAIADFKRVIAFHTNVDSSQINGMLNLGLAYYWKGSMDDALKTCNELIAIAPDEATAYFQRALIYQYRNPPQPALALADYNKAIDLNPFYAVAYLNRGSLYITQLSENKLGVSDFNKTLELDPGNKDALMLKEKAEKNGE